MKEYTKNTIGENIRNLRLQKEIKQTTLALSRISGDSLSLRMRGASLCLIFICSYGSLIIST